MFVIALELTKLAPDLTKKPLGKPVVDAPVFFGIPLPEVLPSS